MTLLFMNHLLCYCTSCRRLQKGFVQTLGPNISEAGSAVHVRVQEQKSKRVYVLDISAVGCEGLNCRLFESNRAQVGTRGRQRREQGGGTLVQGRQGRACGQEPAS